MEITSFSEKSDIDTFLVCSLTFQTKLHYFQVTDFLFVTPVFAVCVR
jgi:hypothetical protein